MIAVLSLHDCVDESFTEQEQEAALDEQTQAALAAARHLTNGSIGEHVVFAASRFRSLAFKAIERELPDDYQLYVRRRGAPPKSNEADR